MDIEEKIENRQCRTCYNSTKGLKLVKTLTKCGGTGKQKSYADLLKEVCNINTIEYNDLLPKFICESCARRLKMAHAFIEQIHKVNNRLISILGKVEANKNLTCLQEPSVDILPTDNIKSEKEDEIDYLEVFGAQCFVELKIEAEQKLITENTNEDILSLNNYGETLTEAKTLANMKRKSCNEEAMDFSNDEPNSRSDSDSDWKQGEDYCPNKRIDKRKSIAKLKRSTLNEDDDIAVPCSECKKIFCNSKALARHKRNTHIPEEQKCTCSLCGRRFSRSCNMYKHMRTFHGPDSVPLIRKPSTKERLFQCEKCERNYTKKSHLNVHVREKHNEKSDIKKESKQTLVNGDDVEKKSKPKKRYEVRSLCSICGSSFASRTHLVVHMRRHTGERPFKCDLCDRAYPRLSELVCHRRIHTGEKPFKCKICDKAFRVWSKMSNHMRSHTDIRPYKCKQCERSFKYSKDLNIHFRIHTGERPYKCNVCGSTFTQSNTLKAHRSKLGHMDDVIIIKNNVTPV